MTDKVFWPWHDNGIYHDTHECKHLEENPKGAGTEGKESDPENGDGYYDEDYMKEVGYRRCKTCFD